MKTNQNVSHSHLGARRTSYAHHFKGRIKIPFLPIAIVSALISSPALLHARKMKTNDEKSEVTLNKRIAGHVTVTFKKPRLIDELDSDSMPNTNTTVSWQEAAATCDNRNANTMKKSDLGSTCKTIEEIIQEDRQIIESNFSNEVFPLQVTSIN